MDWDRVQGSWKQFTGKVKEKMGVSSPTMTLQRSTADVTSSKAKSKSDTELPGIKFARTWMPG